jgi:predicted nucleotidyltransferase
VYNKEMQQAFRIPQKKLRAFCQRYQVRRLAMFGSAARGEARPESDVDLLVAFEPGAQIGFLALGRMRRELSEIFHRPVDLVPQDGLKPVIREQVLAEARELYAA